jgi:hypothetical protein
LSTIRFNATPNGVLVNTSNFPVSYDPLKFLVACDRNIVSLIRVLTIGLTGSYVLGHLLESFYAALKESQSFGRLKHIIMTDEEHRGMFYQLLFQAGVTEVMGGVR